MKPTSTAIVYIVSGLALALSLTAVAFALMSAGPRGATGATGTRGPQGIAGPPGRTVSLLAMQRCLPELVKWVGAFNVSTQSQSGATATWLTYAYLDESAQQVSKPCQKILGFTPSTGGL